MQKLRKVGLETGQLTDEEIRYIDEAVVQTVYPLLVGRQLFPVSKLPDAGFTTVRFFRETDMGQATISMTGETAVRDRLELAADNLNIPVISKDFKIHWRDVIAARRRGEPLDVAHVRNASRQVAEEEDKLLLSGEYSGWKALGIKSFTSTITGKNTEASAGAWPANSVTDVKDAIEEEFTDGYYGPYALILTPAQYVGLLVKYTSERSYLAFIENDILPKGSKILVSPNVFAEDDGVQDSALLVQPGADNFDLVIGQDITTYMVQDEDMNSLGKVYEVLAPRIKRPASICEITTIT